MNRNTSDHCGPVNHSDALARLSRSSHCMTSRMLATIVRSSRRSAYVRRPEMKHRSRMLVAVGPLWATRQQIKQELQRGSSTSCGYSSCGRGLFQLGFAHEFLAELYA